jgi:hypothetical protein
LFNEKHFSSERGCTYADVYAILRNRNTVAWLIPHAAVARKGERVVFSSVSLDDSYRFSFSADGKEIVALAHSPEHLLETCDLVFRLLVASAVHSVILDNRGSFDGALINTPNLASGGAVPKSEVFIIERS